MKQYYVITLVLLLSGCLSAGTHGYIREYNYAVTKYKLEKAVHSVILGNPSIRQDSMKDYYNDDTGYITISIRYREARYKYTFRFYGGKDYWDTSKTSGLFIAYAFNGSHLGGSEGNGGVKRTNVKLRKELTEPFEHEFISKIDSALGMRHAEE